jgi:hypothetical protein
MKWQYTFVTDQNPAELLKKLNQAGEAGWEVVSLAIQEATEPDRLIALVKRQVA